MIRHYYPLFAGHLCQKNGNSAAILKLMLLLLGLSGALLCANVSAQTASDDDDDILLMVPSIVGAIVDPNSSSTNTTPLQPPASFANLCSGYRENDKINRPMPALSRPQPGASYNDPKFGSKITRVTNAGSINSRVMRNLYSTIQAWNADETKMILWHRGEGHYLYNGKTYQLIRKLDINPADLEQVFWSQTNPDTFIYLNVAVGENVNTPSGVYRLKGKELIRYSIASQRYEIVKDFNAECPSGSLTGGSDPQMISANSDVIGLRCDNQGFAYQISNNKTTLLAGSANGNAPQTFPSGQLFYHQGRALNANMAVVRSLALGSVNEHASLGKLDTGHDAYFSVGFDANSNGACNGAIGSLVVHDASTGACSVLVGQATGYPYTLSGTHVSALANKNPGWAVASSVGYGVEGDSLLEQELYLANTHANKRKVCRIAHHRSTGKKGSVGYFAEPHPVISPSGTRILFNSDWNNSGQVDAYVLELPSY